MKINSINNLSPFYVKTNKAFPPNKADNNVSFKAKEEKKYKSAVPIGVEFINYIINKKSPSTKTGIIGSSKQGKTGDCYLLSSVNALSYTEKGAQIIKNSLEYDENGTTVHLKGAGDYYISDKELNRAKSSRLYSKGDDDILLFELAVQKVSDDLLSDRFILSEKLPKSMEYSFLDKSSRLFKPSISSGDENEAMYYITGKVGTVAKTYEQISYLLNRFIENKGKDYALCASFKPDDGIDGTNYWRIYDTQGNIQQIYSKHSYAVKSADKDTVTIVNPHDSGKDITLDREKFLLHFDELYGLDLSDNNPERKFLLPSKKEIFINEGKGFYQLTRRPDGTIYRRQEGDIKVV